jgi:stage V sporulation protein R
VPDIQIVRYEHMGDRSLVLRYNRLRERPLTDDATEVLKHLSRLWGFKVTMEVFEEGKGVVDKTEVSPV